MQLLAGQGDGFDGVGELVQVERADALQLGDAGEVGVGQHQRRAARERDAHQARVDVGVLPVGVVGRLARVVHDQHFGALARLEAGEQFEAGAAAAAFERVAAVGDAAQLIEHEAGHDQVGEQEAAFHDLGDAPVDDRAGVEQGFAGRGLGDEAERGAGGGRAAAQRVDRPLDLRAAAERDADADRGEQDCDADRRDVAGQSGQVVEHAGQQQGDDQGGEQAEAAEQDFERADRVQDAAPEPAQRLQRAVQHPPPPGVGGGRSVRGGWCGGRFRRRRIGHRAREVRFAADHSAHPRRVEWRP